LIAAGLGAVIGIASIHPWPKSLPDPQRDLQQIALMRSGISILLAAGILFIMWRLPKLRLGFVLPFAVMLDLLPQTLSIPASQPNTLMADPPVILARIADIRESAVLHRGEVEPDFYFRGSLQPQVVMKQALHPITGLRWGIQYGATNDVDRLGWKTSSERQARIQGKFPQDEALSTMRRAGMNRVVSLSPVFHRQLVPEVRMKMSEEKYIYIYRLSPPASPFIQWESGTGTFRWKGESSHHIQIQVNAVEEGTLRIARNALPGWQCRGDGHEIEFQSTQDGWIQIPVPQGKHQIDLTYRPPGFIAGVSLTAIGLLAILAILLIG
jgi:hypothetical protein